MAGTFIFGEEKVRPGTYFNIQKGTDKTGNGSIDGAAAVLFRSNWGPLGKAVEISADDDYEKTYGTALTADIIGYVLKGGASKVICCRVGEGGTAGSIVLKLSEGSTDGVRITAGYAGDRPFSASIRDSLADSSMRECIIYDGTKEYKKVSFAKGGNEVKSLADAFAGCMEFSAEAVGEAQGELAAVLQGAFTAGTNPAAAAKDYSNALAVMEKYRFNTICADAEDVGIHELLKAFLNRISNMGQLAQGVVAEKNTVPLEDRMEHAASYNSERIVYVLNTGITNASMRKMQGYQTAAQIAGMIAACPSRKSLTHTVIEGAVQLDDMLTQTEITKAETKGCLVLSSNNSGQVWIDSAINTLVIPKENQDEGWKKIRRTKTRFELITRANNQADELIGRVDNDANGRATITSQIQAIGNAMVEEGKLISCNVEENESMAAEGDSVFLTISCVDKDSAEHIYLTYIFNFSAQED